MFYYATFPKPNSPGFPDQKEFKWKPASRALLPCQNYVSSSSNLDFKSYKYIVPVKMRSEDIFLYQKSTYFMMHVNIWTLLLDNKTHMVFNCALFYLLTGRISVWIMSIKTESFFVRQLLITNLCRDLHIWREIKTDFMSSHDLKFYWPQLLVFIRKIWRPSVSTLDLHSLDQL